MDYKQLYLGSLVNMVSLFFLENIPSLPAVISLTQHFCNELLGHHLSPFHLSVAFSNYDIHPIYVIFI